MNKNILFALENTAFRGLRISSRAWRKDSVIVGLLQGFATPPLAKR